MLGFSLHWIYAHLIGDYLLQNDWMAVNKKKNSWICLVHILTYMMPFLLTDLTWFQLLLIAVQHYVQDRTNFISWLCRIKGSFQIELKQNVLPWGHFIVDNIIHILWMAGVSYYL